MNEEKIHYAEGAPTATEGAPSLVDTAPDTPTTGTRQRPERASILAGDIHRGVFYLALPSVMTMMLQTTNGMLDRFFIGRLGPDALAASTVGNSLLFAIMAAAMAVSVGTTALVARFVGEGNPREADRATQQSITLALLLAVAMAVIMYFLRHPLLTALGLQAAPKDLTERYLVMTLLGLPFLFTSFILNGAFRGIGDTRVPFWVSLGATTVHALMNYLLIFGHYGFPRLGLPGGAIALTISNIVASALYVYFLARSPLYDALSRQGWSIDYHWWWRISRIGIPAAAQQIIRVGSMLGLMGILARTEAGSAAVAAIGVGLVSESLAFMPGFGYSIAASAFVGQNLGASQIDRAERGAWAATWQAIVVMSIMGIVFWFGAHPFAYLFVHQDHPKTADAAQITTTIALTVAYLRLSAWFEPFLAMGMVLTGALQGAGETQSPTVITIVSMVLLRLPLAWLLATHLGMGAVGAWWAMVAGTTLQGILTVIVFKRGKWRRVRV